MRLQKYHGLGNDFLILLDLGGRQPVDGAAARALCDRYRGVGADGLIRVTSGTDGADVTMELRNADGGRAETSGNGLRCLARAVVAAGAVEAPSFTVATGAGIRQVTVNPDDTVTVDMGIPRIQEANGETGGRRALAVDMGNPHLVVQANAVAELGSVWEALAATVGDLSDRNVEVISPGPGADEITMRVWERGVGETQACGTGACAAAAAASRWQLVGERVTVHQPGGDAVVELKPETSLLTGPAEHVCSVEVPWL